MDDDQFYEPARTQDLAVALEQCPDVVAAAFVLVIRQRAILGTCPDPAIEPFVAEAQR